MSVICPRWRLTSDIIGRCQRWQMTNIHCINMGVYRSVFANVDWLDHYMWEMRVDTLRLYIFLRIFLEFPPDVEQYDVPIQSRRLAWVTHDAVHKRCWPLLSYISSSFCLLHAVLFIYFGVPRKLISLWAPILDPSIRNVLFLNLLFPAWTNHGALLVNSLEMKQCLVLM